MIGSIFSNKIINVYSLFFTHNAIAHLIDYIQFRVNIHFLSALGNLKNNVTCFIAIFA